MLRKPLHGQVQTQNRWGSKCHQKSVADDERGHSHQETREKPQTWADRDTVQARSCILRLKKLHADTRRTVGKPRSRMFLRCPTMASRWQ